MVFKQGSNVPVEPVPVVREEERGRWDTRRGGIQNEE